MDAAGNDVRDANHRTGRGPDAQVSQSIRVVGETKCCNVEIQIVLVPKDVASDGAKTAVYRPRSAQERLTRTTMDAKCRKPSDVGMPNVNALLGVAGEPAGTVTQRSSYTSGAQEIPNILDIDCRSFNNAPLAVVNATMAAESLNVAFARFPAC